MANDNYHTPNWLMDLFAEYYDPCPYNPRFEVNGLETEWSPQTFVNPPYSNPLPWVKKAIEEQAKGKLIVMLLKADVSTEYFRLCHQHGEVLFFARRIKFNGETPPWGSMLVIFNGLNEVDDV